MRTLRLCALLLIGVTAFAADTPGAEPAQNPQPQLDWKAQFRAPDGSFQFRSLPDASRLAQTLPKIVPDSGVCYSIRSYKVKRVDGTDETVPAGMTTCTPASRVRVRPAAPQR